MPFNVEAKLKQRIMLVEVLSSGVVTVGVGTCEVIWECSVAKGYFDLLS